MMEFVLENFDTIFRNRKSLDSLEKMMLDLAVRGKLVPQNNEDEPASELLKKIREEKDRLIAEKVIKKEKPLPKIEKEEIPFEIPESWEWVRLGDVCRENPRNGYSPKSVDYETEVKNLKLGATTYGKFNPLEYKYIDENIDDNSYLWLEKEDILIQRSNSPEYVGVSCIFDSDKKFIYPDLMMKIKAFKVETSYLHLVLSSHYSRKYFRDNASGTSQTMPKINQGTVTNALITLPPLAEQQRIVEKVEKMKTIISRLKEIYDSNEINRLNLKKSILAEVESSSSNRDLLEALEMVFNNFNSVIKSKEDVKDIRNLVLSLAVKGKLVPQNPEDEPASELLKKIREEKDRLVAEKVIKKEKQLPKIEDSEIPFEIPENWEWVRLGEIGQTQTGTTPSKENKEYFNGDIPFIKPGDISPLGIDYLNESLSQKAIDEKTGRLIKSNSLLMVCIGGSIGKSYYVTQNVSCNQQVNSITGYSNISSKYFYYFTTANFFQNELWNIATGSATPIINKSRWENLSMPLPPLAEQERIVEKVDSLMKVCDLLESKIEKAEGISKKLLESLLK